MENEKGKDQHIHQDLTELLGAVDYALGAVSLMKLLLVLPTKYSIPAGVTVSDATRISEQQRINYQSNYFFSPLIIRVFLVCLIREGISLVTL